MKLRPGPLESMVFVPEFTGGQRFPFHVVFAVRGGDHDGLGLGAFEKNPLKGGQPGGVQMLDNFDDGRSIEAGQPLVAINERALHHAQARLDHGREAVVVKSFAGDFKRPMRNVHADNLGKLLFLEQRLEQPALATAQVEHPGRPRAFQGGQDRAKALLVQADGFLNGLLLLGLDLGNDIGVRLAFIGELGNRSSTRLCWCLR